MNVKVKREQGRKKPPIYWRTPQKTATTEHGQGEVGARNIRWVSHTASRVPSSWTSVCCFSWDDNGEMDQKWSRQGQLAPVGLLASLVGGVISYSTYWHQIVKKKH